MSADEVEYKTSDTPEAAYLLTLGYPLIEVAKPSTRAFFVFSNNDEAIKQSVFDYYSGRASVEPTLYFLNYRKLVRRAREGV